MKDFARLIERYHLPLALTISFVVLGFLIPFFYYRPSPNLQYSALSMRCLFLDAAATVVFYLLERGKFRSLLFVSLSGALTSLLYLKTNHPLLLPFCMAFTISSVITVSLLAYYYLSKGGKP